MPSRRPSLLASLVAASLLGIAVWVSLDAGDGPTGDDVVHVSLAARGDSGSPEAGPATANQRPSLAVDTAACVRAAYLCSGLEERGQPLVARWSDDIAVLRVLVLAPPHEESRAARRLQDAAVRGIRAWHRQPFPLRIETARRIDQPHVTVTWNARLDGTELGHVRTRWRVDEGVSDFTVEAFVLATRHPARSDALLSAADVELAAAHEMGHALGLPHSPDSTDLMYATNTARRLSVDDYRAVEALYRMPPGARLPQRARPEGP